MSTNAAQHGSPMSSVANTTSDSDLDSDSDVKSLPTQEIPSKDINRARLRSMLTIKFGIDAYDMHVSRLLEASLYTSLLFCFCHPTYYKDEKLLLSIQFN